MTSRPLPTVLRPRQPALAGGALALLATLSASAASDHLSPSGDDAHAGPSSATAWCTLGTVSRSNCSSMGATVSVAAWSAAPVPRRFARIRITVTP